MRLAREARITERTGAESRSARGKLAGNVEPYLDEKSLKQLQRIVGRFSNREHLVGVAVLNTKLEPIAASVGLVPQVEIRPFTDPQVIADNKKERKPVHSQSRQGSAYLYTSSAPSQ